MEESVEPVADTVYWGGDPDAEQVERLRQLSFEFEYAVEAYVAALAAGAEPWGGDGGRSPSWEPLAEGPRPTGGRDAGDEGDAGDGGVRDTPEGDAPGGDAGERDDAGGRDDADGPGGGDADGDE